MNNANTNIETKPAQKSIAKIIAKAVLFAVMAGVAVYFLIDHIAYDRDAAPFLGIFVGIAWCIVATFFAIYKITPIGYKQTQTQDGFCKFSTQHMIPNRLSPSHPQYHTNPLNPASPNYRSLYDEYRTHLH